MHKLCIARSAHAWVPVHMSISICVCAWNETSQVRHELAVKYKCLYLSTLM